MTELNKTSNPIDPASFLRDPHAAAGKGIGMRRLLVATAAVGLILSALSASADQVGTTDPDDVTGRFDISETAMDHPPDKVVFSTTVFGTIAKRHFTNGNYFQWIATTDGASTATSASVLGDPLYWYLYFEGVLPFSASASAGGGTNEIRMKCFVFLNGQREYRGRGRITEHKGTCKIPRSVFGGVPNHFQASSIFNGNVDNAPDEGMVEH